MMLGLDNSMHDKDSGDLSMCKLTLFAPYWIDNRSGLDLTFKDGPSGKGQPLLLGAHTIFDYALVKAPGNALLKQMPACSSTAVDRTFECKHQLDVLLGMSGMFARYGIFGML